MLETDEFWMHMKYHRKKKLLYFHTFRLAAIWQYPLRLKLHTSSNSAPTYAPPETLQHVCHEGLLEHSQYLNIFVGNCVTVKSTNISICIRVNNALWYIWTMDYIAFGMNELNYIHQYICNSRAMLSKKCHCRRICLGVPYIYVYISITLFIYIFKAIICILDLFLVVKS